MFKNKVETSTCHICLEDLSYKPKNIKKKCCPTKAFICNRCWDSLNNNDCIVQCPLCKQSFEHQDIEAPMDNCSCQCCSGDDIKDTKLFIIRLFKYICYELVGIMTFTLFIFNIHSIDTTFQEELNYLITSPFFWIISFFLGIFIIHMVHIFYIIIEYIITEILKYIKK